MRMMLQDPLKLQPIDLQLDSYSNLIHAQGQELRAAEDTPIIDESGVKQDKFARPKLAKTFVHRDNMSTVIQGQPQQPYGGTKSPVMQLEYFPSNEAEIQASSKQALEDDTNVQGSNRIIATKKLSDAKKMIEEPVFGADNWIGFMNMMLHEHIEGPEIEGISSMTPLVNQKSLEIISYAQKSQLFISGDNSTQRIFGDSQLENYTPTEPKADFASDAAKETATIEEPGLMNAALGAQTSGQKKKKETISQLDQAQNEIAPNPVFEGQEPLKLVEMIEVTGAEFSNVTKALDAGGKVKAENQVAENPESAVVEVSRPEMTQVLTAAPTNILEMNLDHATEVKTSEKEAPKRAWWDCFGCF